MEDRKELKPEELDKVAGGFVVDEGDGRKYWMVRHDGTVIGPAPTLENAIAFAKEFNESPTVLTREQYRARFGRELVW